MKYRRHRVDLRSFLATEIPLHELPPDLRQRVRHAVAVGGDLREVGLQVARVLLRSGSLRPAGVLRDGNERIPVYSVGRSPRVFDLRSIFGEPESSLAQHPRQVLTSTPRSTVGVPAEVSEPEAPTSTVTATSATHGANAHGAARASLAAIRRTLSRDWVSHGLEASLETVLAELSDRLADPSLHLVLWSERIRLSLGPGPRWELRREDEGEAVALEGALRAAGADGAHHEGRRWLAIDVDGALAGALGSDPGAPAELFAEATRTVQELLLAFLRSQQRVHTDPLTGLNNRGFFDHQIGVELERARRLEHELALLFVDLDHFKQINDRFGHDAGDLVLQHVARLMQGHLRRIDYVFRWGGEEFAMLLPGTGADQAVHTAERLREVIARSPVTIASGESIRVTVSIGAAMAPLHARGGERELLRHADQALYQAKQEGRNRVRLWREDRDRA